MPETQERRPSARVRVDERNSNADQISEQRQAIEERIIKATKWFGKVAPTHIDPDQYVALAIGQIRKDGKLAMACAQNPESLMVALVDCARLGLVVGETYHITHFWNSKAGIPDIVGMVDYKGEIELIYRTGKVDAVFVQEVRGHQGAKSPDKFLWKPGMVIPDHEIADDGLADPSDRGYLRGAYAYARLAGGGFSPVIVLSKAQVLKHRDISKTDKFWGPEWPGEGLWTENMWRKTPAHILFDRVPHSVEYLSAFTRGMAAAVDASSVLGLPMPGVAAVGPADAPLMLAGAVELPDGGRRRPVRSQVDRPVPTAQLRKNVAELFADAGFGEPNSTPQRAVASMLVRESPDDPPVTVGSLADLTHTQLTRLGAKLRVLRDEAVAAGRDPAGDLLRLAHAATGQGGAPDGK
jgi:recombination protein RecT